MKRLTKKHIETIFENFTKVNPDPQGELTHESVFELLVAVVLSAQATDVSVNKATIKLFAVANTPASVYALGVDGLIPYIRTIGLFNSKAKNIIQLCKDLMDFHNSEVPNTLPKLIKLPGVGRKTANVVLQMAFGEDTIAVDTHVYRVSRRLGLSKSITPDTVEQDLYRVIPKKYHRYAHHWLILHGRYLCKARKPDCQKCPLPCISREHIFVDIES